MGDHRAPQRHIVVGNLNLDISLSLDRYPEEDSHVFARDAWIGLGGAATNYAVAVARLGHKPVLVARTGSDAVKLGLLDELESIGVDVSGVRIVQGEPMGIVIVVLVPERGSRTMLSIRGANEGLTHYMVPKDGSATVYHFASVRPSIVTGACRSWERRGFLVSYDPGGEAYRRPREVLGALGCVDIVFANERELTSIMRASGLRSPSGLLGDDEGPRIVVVKKGEGGAIAYTSAGDALRAIPPARQVNSVDVTGAGDAFDAAFNIWLAGTGDIIEALRYATAAGAAKVSRRGSSNMPSLEEVERVAESVRIEPAVWPV